MGVIDSLSAGYRLITRHIELLLVPLLLDIFLWFAPRLSIAPLLRQFAEMYNGLLAGSGNLPPDMSQLSQQMDDMLALLGETSNLFQLLVNGALYHVPSLLATLPALQGGQGTVEIGSLGAAVTAFLALGLAGLLVGVVYMNLLARALPLGEGEKGRNSSFVSLVLRHWMRSILFLVGLVGLLLAIYIPATVGVSLLMLINTALGIFAMFLLSGLIVLVLFNLYFVTAGIVLDDLAVRPAVVRSVILVRYNFFPTLGLILITTLIATGMALLLQRVAAFGSAGVLIAAALNAFIGTGLAMAILVFYRTRLLVLAERLQQGQM
ncbi:MAG: hypothetical protein D6790_07935 [Caldilineae bacterium]|nr:MAG: hypothetical protein D6790_07935 [Caldilineae bacterium]